MTAKGSSVSVVDHIHDAYSLSWRSSLKEISKRVDAEVMATDPFGSVAVEVARCRILGRIESGCILETRGRVWKECARGREG
jgi:hypothetical protein